MINKRYISLKYFFLCLSIFLSIILMSIFSYYLFHISSNEKILRVGIPGEWKTLIPALQHRVYSDAILANQFEPLVRVGKSGMILPLAAIEWNVSEQFKTFTFKIDTRRRFSDGQRLSAHDFKRSWEKALSLIPKSSNNNLLEILYRVEGYEDYEKTGKLSGLIAKGNDTFIVKLREPLRVALSHFSSNRSAAFRQVGNKYLGTGPYVIVKSSDKRVDLLKNKYSFIQVDFDKAIYYLIPPEKAEESLKSGKVDLFTFAGKAHFKACEKQNESDTEGCFIGSESRHSTLIVNGMKGRFFENKNHRRALQALVFKHLPKEPLPLHISSNLNINFQVYLPFQKGWIPKAEAHKIILDGEKYIEDLIEATKKTPIRVNTAKSTAWAIGFLKRLGLHLSDDSGVLYPQQGRSTTQEYYKTHRPDVMPVGLGSPSTDPDGIYHALGKNGFISSPMAFRKKVTDLLEIGRGILNTNEIREHYEEVTRAILEEVPFVHLGFRRTKIAYRKDRIKVKDEFKHREEHRLIKFTPL